MLFNNLPGPYPKMIKLTIGNMVLKNLIQFLKRDWNAIALLSEQYRIVIANSEFIEVFD